MCSDQAAAVVAPALVPGGPVEHPGAVAISVRGISKCYGIYAKPADRLKQTLWRGKRQFYKEFWALRHISFDVRRGEAVGIIGRNGSGKSTLLQIIAGTLRPTEGEVTVHGRVAALLELGSGFNPDFTGRENVYLNGAILGLSRQEIDARFDAIAEFAEIGSFLEQPIKTYSTGMVVRLAFAVQVQVEPDILIVDEALAVGDAAFQIKCMKRMRHLIERGTSIVLVSHDVSAVRMFCPRALWLDQGRLVQAGGTHNVTSGYMRFLFGDGTVSAEEVISASAPAANDSPQDSADNPPHHAEQRPLQPLADVPKLVRWGSGEIMVEAFAMDNGTPGTGSVFEHGDRLNVEMQVRALQAVDSPNLGVAFSFRNTKGLDIITYTSWDAGVRLAPMGAGDVFRVQFAVTNILAPGEYALVLEVEDVRDKRHYFDFVENATLFRVLGNRLFFSVVLPEVNMEIMPSHVIREMKGPHGCSL